MSVNPVDFAALEEMARHFRKEILETIHEAGFRPSGRLALSGGDINQPLLLSDAP